MIGYITLTLKNNNKIMQCTEYKTLNKNKIKSFSRNLISSKRKKITEDKARNPKIKKAKKIIDLISFCEQTTH